MSFGTTWGRQPVPPRLHQVRAKRFEVDICPRSEVSQEIRDRTFGEAFGNLVEDVRR